MTARDTRIERLLSIDADGIRNSRRYLQNATDILGKLKPEMVSGITGFCGAAQELFINGERIRREWVTISDMEMFRRAGPAAALPEYIRSALSRIQPEHIAEMRTHDCAKGFVKGIGAI